MADCDGSTEVQSYPAATKEAARVAGFKKYFNGVPCKHGHVAERWVCNAHCVECALITNRKSDRKRYKKKLEWLRDWGRRNPERIRYFNQKSYKKRTATREGVLAIRSKNWPVQPTRPEPPTCELCGSPPRGGRTCLYLDHDHETNKFRGWLCSHCNWALGQLGDNAASLRRALLYLEGKINGIPTA